MPKKKKYSVARSAKDFEDLVSGQREPLPEGSLLEAIWLLAKYSEKDRGYTAREMASSLGVKESKVRNSVSTLFGRGYFLSFVVESNQKNKKKPGATPGVLRDVFASDEIWNDVWERRVRRYLLPHMQRAAHMGELTAYARPHLLPQVAALFSEVDASWSDSKKRITRGTGAKK